MPRLNYGTLLENIVVKESTGVALDRLATERTLGFATSFAMPPITQCWCKASEEAASPHFNHASLLRLSTRTLMPGSLQAVWSLCTKNLPKLPVRRFHQSEGRLLYDSGGPNGALLASLLALQSGRQIHLWVNDNGERYPRLHRAGAPGPMDEVTAAATLLGTEPMGSSSTQVAGWFPDSIPRLATWIDQGAGRATGVRVGFLDPDNYAEGETQVSSFDHREWLRTLATDCSAVISATFSGCQNRGQVNVKRDQRLMSFHSDEAGLYPDSVVFEYGNSQTGVKMRWPQSSAAKVAAELRQRVEGAWRDWERALGPLTVHINGKRGD